MPPELQFYTYPQTTKQQSQNRSHVPVRGKVLASTGQQSSRYGAGTCRAASTHGDQRTLACLAQVGHAGSIRAAPSTERKAWPVLSHCLPTRPQGPGKKLTADEFWPGVPNSSREVGKQGCLLRVAGDVTQSPGSPYVPLAAQEECVSLQTQVKRTCSAAQADPELGPKVPTALNDIAHQKSLPPSLAPSLTSWASCPLLPAPPRSAGGEVACKTETSLEGFVTKNI